MIKNLKTLRIRQKLSQSALGKVLGVTQQTIYKYENTATEPDYSMLVRIADYFDVSIDYLLGRTDDGTAFFNKSTEKNITLLLSESLEVNERYSKILTKLYENYGNAD